MSGESTLAKQLVQQALQAARQDPAMSEQSMCNALLTAAVIATTSHLQKKDILEYVEYDLDHINTEFEVVTRGC